MSTNIISIIIIIIFIIILINTRWMNGSGRGALLFESEGRWSMIRKFCLPIVLLSSKKPNKPNMASPNENARAVTRGYEKR